MLKRFAPIAFVTGLCWVVFAANHFILHDYLNHFGIVPRHVSGLPGILFSPFLQGSFQHLMANTLPLLILGGVLCGRSVREFWEVVTGGILVGGALTWLFARTAYHIGASGLIFCFFGYLASLAIFRRTFGTLTVTLACVIGYGGILRGVLPGTPGVSWEGHLAGFVAGVFLAWLNGKFSEPEPVALADFTRS